MRGPRAIAAAAGLLAAGCATLLTPEATASLNLRVAYVPATYRVQAAVTPYTDASVNHVVFKLFTVSGNTESEVAGREKDVAKADLAAGLPYTGLALSTTYRVRAYAYKAAGTSTADRISLEASSSIEVTVGSAATVAIATLSIYLSDVTFDGQATGSLAVTAGTLATPTAPVTATWAP